MWARTLVCGLVALNVGRNADNVGLDPLLFANNVVPKSPLLWVGAILIVGRYT